MGDVAAMEGVDRAAGERRRITKAKPSKAAIPIKT
jgi:hypothetical protein